MHWIFCNDAVFSTVGQHTNWVQGHRKSNIFSLFDRFAGKKIDRQRPEFLGTHTIGIFRHQETPASALNLPEYDRGRCLT